MIAQLGKAFVNTSISQATLHLIALQWSVTRKIQAQNVRKAPSNTKVYLDERM